MKNSRCLLLLSFLFLFSFEALSEIDRNSYSARFKVTEQFGFQKSISPMQFTVFDKHVIRELPQQNIIEHWVQRNSGSHVFYRHFPEYKSSIHYTRGDLRAFNLDGEWSTVVQVVPERWLTLLERVGEGASDFGLVQSFKGKLGDDQVAIDWIQELGIPLRFSIRRQHQGLTIELIELSKAEGKLNQLHDWDTYRKIDFSDAMDMERDSFVQYLLATGKLETNGGGPHIH
ncbi:hypothetical protein J4N45_21025 [Vibrio sp. SCSIO 43140]|uniref:hypothetical protein n=1 Tax=Vibrio sp. SCSIO 43140 TaxID=2819100 RepID=UPI00207646D5|nr:hypothetical protein [Vibrio sp. SCSIO 43140]USD63466.1 hypothetical protein J4N45_21025 [Vibrio sp. SCSIO 43140]